MEPRYAKSFVESLFRDRDLAGLHQVIDSVSQDRALREEFWYFSRLLEWLWARSGVWQYYEGIDPATYSLIEAWLRRNSWPCHVRYTQGMFDYSAGGDCEQLEAWLHSSAIVEIESSLVDLIRPHSGELSGSE